ncbi:MAG: HNH endonuclease [Gammaproteobacteria bacterium]|nr:HNH endonuclease [Gammaproteobacteria bacterium]
MASSVYFEPRFEQTAADRLGDEITELCGYIYAATCHLLELIREFDENRHWEAQGFSSCAHWLNFHCGMGFGTAREHLRVAHALPALPQIQAEFSEGKLSFSKVRAMTRVARPENEEFLLMVARHGTANHVERLVSQYRRCQKLNHPYTANDLYRAREVTYHYDDDGCLVMKARMPADMGELIVKALEMAMDSQEPNDDPIAARRADAMAEVAETYLNHPENAGSTADRYQVVVHSAGNTATYLENGPHLSAETSRRVACDCCKTEVKDDENGEPLNIGRRSRTIPPAMRRALKTRDGGCRFPGCTGHKFCDGHHIKHWSDGGETSLDNLVLLCRHHHRLVHEGGFDCVRSKNGEIYFVDGRHKRLNEFQQAKPVAIEEALAWMYRKFADRDVSADDGALGSTCAAKWYAGEEMDMEYAVWVMSNIKPLE